MKQFLPRGYHITKENRIKKLFAGGDNWQIYLTNIDSYVLAVKTDLYNNWIDDYLLPTGIFSNLADMNLWVCHSSSNYIISSMEHGPFPNDKGQIEAFSIAFKTAVELYDHADIHDAIYIEEFSLLLPVTMSNNEHDNSIVYGKWLTGGIHISIDSIKRVSTIMSWLSKDALIESAKLAGFTVPVIEEECTSDEVQMQNGENFDLVVPDSIDVFPTKDKFILVGRPELEQFFNDNIVDIVLNQEQYRRMGILFPGATILHGPPGCGKTYAVEKLVDYLGWKRFDIDSSTIASSYIHDTSKKISEVFNDAIKASPSIIVIDEMEAFLSNRSMAGMSGTYHIEEVAEFLRRIPEAISKGVLVFAMTNLIDSIDPAILRRGRFDHIVEVKMPTTEEIDALLQVKFNELPVANDVSTKRIAEDLSNRPMSDVAYVLREAGRFAVKRNLELITEECFADAIALLPKKKERLQIGFGR